MTFKGQGRISKIIANKIANYHRKHFSKLVYLGKIKCVNKKPIQQAFEIISISGNNYFEEQVLSILSFVENIGVPKNWIIFSDGSYSDKHKALLMQMFDFVQIKEWNEVILKYPKYGKALDKYLQSYPIAKKTYILLNYQTDKPFLFIDSDVVFYTKFIEYLHLLNIRRYNYFSVDNDWCCLDPKYMNSKDQDMFQLNSGLLYILPDFERKPALNYIEKVEGKYHFFDQTALHIAFFSEQNNNVMPFDPRCFKVETADHFKIKMAPITKFLAVRHYVGPVRHKMWQKGWKWHIN